MNAFVPPGYLSFDDAIDRVAEITMLARESTSPAAHEDTDPEPPRPGFAKGEFKGIWDKEAAMIEQRLLAKEELRKLLYTEQIPSAAIEENGSCHPAPGYIWGGKQWSEALYYNRITFSYGDGTIVSGRPLIPREALEAAFNPDGTVKDALAAADPKERRVTQAAEAAKQSNRGPKPIWDWEGAVAHLLSVANSPDGLPDRQSDIERLVADWFRQTIDKEPVESAIRKHVSAWCKEVLEKASNSPTNN